MEMHVDGFRFDLASTLARELFEVDRLSAFFDLVQQDPVAPRSSSSPSPGTSVLAATRSATSLPLWSEWNGRYRDTIRDFWRGEPAVLAEFGFASRAVPTCIGRPRRPTASVNFVYGPRRVHLGRPGVLQRQAQRGQRGRQPRRQSHNRSWNCSVEGPTDDPAVLALRQRQRRNLLPRCCCRRACR